MNVGGGTYLEFVLPGILALSAMNNSFGPVSTSLNISKLYTKTIEEVLVSPVSPWDIALGRTLTGLVRGLFSALMLMLVGLVSGVHLHYSLSFFVVLALTAFCFGAAGVAAAMLAHSHEDMANFNSFFIIPMSFLAGTFFSPDRLPRAVPEPDPGLSAHAREHPASRAGSRQRAWLWVPCSFLRRMQRCSFILQEGW